MTEWKPYMNPAAGEKKYSLYKTISLTIQATG